MKGHVFVVRGDITKLACDAWFASCDYRAKPRRSFVPSFWEGSFEGTPFQGRQRVQKLSNWPKDWPQPWLTNVGGTKDKPVKWYIEGVTEFLDRAKASLLNRAPLFGRSKHLVALPVVGTGRGGAAESAGKILEEMLPALRNFTSENEVDVVLVAFSPTAYAAAQAERNKIVVWPDPIAELKNEADYLAKTCLQGKLAVFIGAGVSRAAGLPDWAGLLHRLAIRARRGEDECKALTNLKSYLDQATIIQRWLEGVENIGNAVKEELGGYHHYSLSHAFLAALPVREVITTNYDQLFEHAWRSHDLDEFSVLPGNLKPNSQRWLLKMHGCLSKPEQVVLTRSDYTRYDESLPGLAGIVQAFLVTRHMLFVGFSLTDDNFHRIVDYVRRIRASAKEEEYFGTALSLKGCGLEEVLWEKDLHRVRVVQDHEGKYVSDADAARRLEIFLDYLLSRTRDTNHLLVGKRFDNVLSESERKIRDALQGFVKDLRSGGEAVTQTVAWRHIEPMLIRLGFNPKELEF